MLVFIEVKHVKSLVWFFKVYQFRNESFCLGSKIYIICIGTDNTYPSIIAEANFAKLVLRLAFAEIESLQYNTKIHIIWSKCSNLIRSDRLSRIRSFYRFWLRFLRLGRDGIFCLPNWKSFRKTKPVINVFCQVV